jgi:tetratricopeptide (TPR) repeat protein
MRGAFIVIRPLLRYPESMKRRFLLVLGIVFSLFSVFPLIGSELSVEFLEGYLDYNEGKDTWISAEIGDIIPSGSRIKLSGQGYAELEVGPRKVTLTHDGVYDSSELISEEPEKFNFRQIIGSKFSSLLRHNEGDSGMTVVAVRGAEAESSGFMSWEDDNADFLIDGKLLFEQGDLQGAMALFDEGTVWETGAVRRECAFRLAVCQQIIGNPRATRKTLATISPESDDPYLGEYTVTMATLFIESRDFADADEVLGFYLDANPRGDAAQAAWLLSAFSLEAQGDEAGQRESLRKAVDLGPNTEIGRAAASRLH